MLHLIDPTSPPRWAPFLGVRPVAELRAGVWRIRERWEHLLGTNTVAIHAPACAGFTELDEPPC
ncbi:MAG: putative sugar nucleotidyl transferase, partial [Gemmatimonadales bacterium]